MATAIQLALFLVVSQVNGLGKVATINDTGEERLAYMQASGATYEVTIGDADRGEKATFRRDPVLRWTNPVSGVVDGGLFVWEDASRRPVAAAQIFIVPNADDVWLHEFQSLTTEPMQFRYNGRIAWAPNSAGVNFEAISGAPKPASTPAARLLQMRRLAGRFSVKDDFEGKDKDRLRLMSTPLVRYRDNTTSDGALFVYAHGTDPEMFVIIEARVPDDSASDQRDPVWHVALAPMTSYAIIAELDGNSYWSVPWRQDPIAVTATFKNFVFPPTH